MQTVVEEAKEVLMWAYFENRIEYGVELDIDLKSNDWGPQSSLIFLRKQIGRCILFSGVRVF
jgi:hypothetical protein